MHPRRTMQEQHTESGAESQPRSEGMSPSAAGHPRVRKLLSFARRHPALSVVGAAGAGLIAGPEIALGMVLGAGVAMLIERGTGRRVDEEAVEAARSVRQRARHMLGAETVKQRARAVIQAARGQISPVPPPAGESQRQPTSEVAGPPAM